MSACDYRPPRGLEQREGAAWVNGVLDLGACDRLELCVTLFEHEKPEGLRPEKWPREVAGLIERHLAEWIEKNPARAVRAVTYATPHFDGRRYCVAIVHHVAREG
jgi:hypothetical protein